MVKRDQLLVFGGGKFGVKILENFQASHQVIVVDETSNCQASKEIQDHFQANKLHDIFKRIHTSPEPIFIEGNIETVISLWQKIQPAYLIPVVPIHVMHFFLKKYLKQYVKEIDINEAQVPPILSKPKELYIFQADPSNVYLSYADKDQICPDNCMGPADYCPFHKKPKPITVTDFCKESFPSSFHFNFESAQLAPGIGGLPNQLIFTQTERLMESCSTLHEATELTLLISTTCNCHGVISAFSVKKRSAPST